MLTANEIASKLRMPAGGVRKYLVDLNRRGKLEREKQLGGGKWQYVYPEAAVEMVRLEIEERAARMVGESKVPKIVRERGGNQAWAAGYGSFSIGPIERKEDAIEEASGPCPCCGRVSGLINGQCFDSFYGRSGR